MFSLQVMTPNDPDTQVMTWRKASKEPSASRLLTAVVTVIFILIT